jgi:hypothetical protein
MILTLRTMPARVMSKLDVRYLDFLRLADITDFGYW